MPAAQARKPSKSQVNARIDAELKHAGDEGLAAAGLTPTQAVRAVWEFAARHKDNPNTIIAALFPDKKMAEEQARQAERDRKLALVDDASGLMERAYRENGLVWPPATSKIKAPTYKELRDIAYEERYQAYLEEQ